MYYDLSRNFGQACSNIFLEKRLREIRGDCRHPRAPVCANNTPRENGSSGRVVCACHNGRVLPNARGRDSRLADGVLRLRSGSLRWFLQKFGQMHAVVKTVLWLLQRSQMRLHVLAPIEMDDEWHISRTALPRDFALVDEF